MKSLRAAASMGLALQFAACMALSSFFAMTIDVRPAHAQASACNIATNGSFESPNIQTEPQRAGENTAYVNGYAIWRTTTYPIDGWQTVSGTVDFLRHYNNASHGAQSLDLFGTAAATFRQTFTGLVPGQSYSFSIDYSGHSASQAPGLVQLGNGAGVTPVTIASLRPAADSVSNGNTGIPNTPAYSVTWTTFQHTFVAADTEATIQFVETGTGSTGLFIDNFTFASNAPCADLSISKDDGTTSFTRGAAVTYTIVVSNAGPDAATGAQVSDPLPPGITSASWTCGSATGGASCGAASGSGGINTTANLPAGGSVTYTLNMNVPAGYPGVNLTNTATVTAPAGTVEPDTNNNTDSDTNAVSPPQPSFGSCTSTMYLGVGAPTQLVSVDTSTNPFTYPPIGAPYSPNYNAIGYDPLSNFIYAAVWDTATSLYHLLRIGGDGSVADLGAITGGGINAGAGIASGEVGADGFFYVKHNGTTNHMWRVDLATRTATLITLSQSFASGDLTWSNGLLYAQDHVTGSLVRVDPTNGNVVPIGPSGFVGGADAFGSMMGASNGVFGRRNSGGFYKFDIATGAATLISDAPAGGGDGAKCATSPLELPFDLAITKDDGATTYIPGGDVNYTIVVSNSGPFGVQNAAVSDQLPPGITTATWTCGSATGGGVCDTTSGTGAINTTADLPSGASVTYTLNMTVPVSFSGSLTNTATVTAPVDSPESNTSNNIASDTDTMEPPPTSGVCSPRTVVAGNTFTLAPFPVTGSVTKTAGAWQTDNPWATQGGGNYTIRWNFSQPIPANWIQFAVVDVNETGTADYNALPPIFTIGLGAGSTATTANFSLVDGDLTYSGGALRYVPGGPYRQSGYLAGNSAGTVTSITITSSRVGTGDNIANVLYVRPPCLTVSKVSSPTTGSFQIDMSNVVDASGSVLASTMLTTTQSGTAVSSPMYFARDTRQDVVLSEVVPAGWSLDSAVCTDQNAATTGNPTFIGSFTSPAITIPAANVRPQADIRCTFTNDGTPATLTLQKQVVNDNGGTAAVADFVLRAENGATVIEGPTADAAVTNASVPAGTYLLSETNLPGYAPSLYSCSIDGAAAVDGNSLTLGTGEAAVCTITNDDLVPQKALTGESGLIAGVAEPGETLTYTVTLTNNGAGTATYDLVDNIDDNTTYVSGSTGGTAGAAEPTGTDPLTWSGVSIPAGTSVTVDYDVLVADPMPSGVTQVSNAATNDCTANPGACVVTPASGTATPAKQLAGEDGTRAGVAEPGETLTYTVTLTNNDMVQAVYDLVDNIDDNTTYVAGSATVAGIGREPVGSDPLTWSDIIVPASGTVVVIYDVLVDDPLDPSVTEIRNAADDCVANLGACVVVPAVEQADLAITKTNGSDTYVPGDNIVYTIVVANNGPADVVSALVNDPLPSGFSSATWTCGTPTGGASCGVAGGSGPIVNAPVDLPTGATVTFTLTLPIPPGTTGEIINPASVTSPPEAHDPNLANNTTSHRDVYPLVDITKALTAESGQIAGVAEPGETLTYTLTIDNREAFVATYDPFDNIDDNTVYVVGSATLDGTPREPDVVGDPLVWTGISIPVGGSVNITYQVTVADPIPAGVTQIRNAATEDCAAYPQACVVTPTPGIVTPSKALTAETGILPGVAEPGETLTYTVTLANSGLGANLYDLTDNIDDNTTYVAGSSAGTAGAGEPDTATDPLVWNDIPVPAGASLTVEYQVTVVDPIPDGVTEIRNAATDDCVANPDACVVTPTPGSVTPSKALTAETGILSGVAEPGETLTYTVTLTNATAAGGSHDLVDNIDDNTTYVAGSATVAGAADEPVGTDPLTWDDIIVPANGTVAVVYQVTVVDPIPTGVTQIRNAATDDCTANPQACVTTPTPGVVVPSKALTAESGIVAGVAEPGETLTYTVTLTNATAAAAAHDLVDNIDGNTAYVAASATVGGTAREPVGSDPLTWDDIIVPANGAVAVVYQVTVADPIPTGVTQVTNAATNDCTANPQACVVTPTPGAAVPSKTITAESGLLAGVAEPGEVITYTVTLTNSGTATAIHDLVDNIDGNTVYVAGSATVDGTASEPDAATDPLVWNDVVVPSGDTVDLVYQVTVADPIPTGVTEIRNAATDDCAANPQACVITPTPGTAVPSKSLTGETGILAGTAEPGETLTYTVTLTNSGTVAALHDLVDNIDDNTDYVAGSATVAGTPDEPDTAGDPLTWYDVVVPAGSSVDVVYQVTVVDPIPVGITAIRNAATDDCAANPQACVITPTPGTAAPSKALTGENGLVTGVAEAGETLTYTVTLTNSGTSAAVYSLSDNIDDNTDYVAGSSTVAGAADEPDTVTDPLRWTNIAVPAASTVDVVYQVTVDDPIPLGVTEIRNAATDDCEVFPQACVVTPTPGLVTPLKELTAEDGVADDVAEPGETLTFRVTLTNRGTGATLYDLADNIDDNTAYVAGSSTVAGVADEPDTATDPLIWNDILVPGGGSVEVLYQVIIDDPLDAAIVALRNIAYDGNTPEPTCEDVPDQCVVLDTPEPEIALEKGGEFQDENGNGVAEPGETILYTFTVTNDGNVPLDEVEPRDPGPTFNRVNGTGTLSPFAPASGVSPVSLDPGELEAFTAEYELTQADIDNGAGIEDAVENTATAVGMAFATTVTSEEVESDEAVAVLALPLPPSDITVTKIASLRYIRRGEEAPFTISVTNNAASFASGLTVIDTLPSGFRFVEGSATIDGTPATPVVEGSRVIFENITVAGNSKVDIRLRMLALSSAGPGEHVNRANVTDASGNRLAPEATASVEILVEPVFDCGDIIGRVFDDENRNGYQDEGELGLPGVRVATVNGWLVTTDVHGRFNVPCAALPDQRIGSNFIMKVDARTLPTGYRLTTENPRVVRLTAGKMTELNFGASVGRLVRLDLQDAAFEPGRIELREQWAEGIDELIAFLAVEQSVLRLTYIEAGGDIDLAQERLEHLGNLIGERWRQTSGQYRLDIEMRVETGQ